MKITFLVLLCFLFSSCGEKNSSGSNDNSPSRGERETGKVLSGKIGGNDWTFKMGRASKSSISDSEFRFSLWNIVEEDICDQFIFGSDEKLLGIFPVKVGSVELGLTYNINFAFLNHNNIATSGKLVITKITDDYIFGRLSSKFDNENYVNGEFKLKKCY